MTAQLLFLKKKRRRKSQGRYSNFIQCLYHIEYQCTRMYVPTGELSVVTVAFGNDVASVAVNAPDVVKFVTDELIDSAVIPAVDETV